MRLFAYAPCVTPAPSHLDAPLRLRILRYARSRLDAPLRPIRAVAPLTPPSLVLHQSLASPSPTLPPPSTPDTPLLPPSPEGRRAVRACR